VAVTSVAVVSAGGVATAHAGVVPAVVGIDTRIDFVCCIRRVGT
jgi:hypothetical protein